MEQWITIFFKKFSIKHLSAYQLVIEKGTKFYDLFNKGKLKTVSDKLYKQFYFSTKNILTENKFNQYEISNFSKPNYFSKHIQFTGNQIIGLELAQVQLAGFGILKKKE